MTGYHRAVGRPPRIKPQRKARKSKRPTPKRPPAPYDAHVLEYKKILASDIYFYHANATPHLPVKTLQERWMGLFMSSEKFRKDIQAGDRHDLHDGHKPVTKCPANVFTLSLNTFNTKPNTNTAHNARDGTDSQGSQEKQPNTCLDGMGIAQAMATRGTAQAHGQPRQTLVELLQLGGMDQRDIERAQAVQAIATTKPPSPPRRPANDAANPRMTHAQRIQREAMVKLGRSIGLKHLLGFKAQIAALAKAGVPMDLFAAKAAIAVARGWSSQRFLSEFWRDLRSELRRAQEGP